MRTKRRVAPHLLCVPLVLAVGQLVGCSGLTASPNPTEPRTDIFNLMRLQGEDQVETCRSLAAGLEPFNDSAQEDPDSPSIDVDAARAACVTALKREPTNPELIFNYGLTQLASDDFSGASDSFNSARSAVCAASYYWAVAALSRPDGPFDLTPIRESLEAAVRCGDEAATNALASLRIDKNQFTKPAFIGALLKGGESGAEELDDISWRPLIGAYLTGFFEDTISERWLPIDVRPCVLFPEVHRPGALNRALASAVNFDSPDPLTAAAVRTIVALLSYADSVFQGDSYEKTVAIIRSQGATDALRLLEITGACNSGPMRQAMATVEIWSAKPKPLASLIKKAMADPKAREYAKAHATDLRKYKDVFGDLLSPQVRGGER